MNIRQRLSGWRREDRGWPRYMPGGRIRTSTAGLVVAFMALFWIHQVYEPPAAQSPEPTTQMVPPGFVPDPDYTWVPRTNVRTREPEFTTTPTATTTTTTPTTSPTGPTTSPDGTTTTGPAGPTTTVIDPDGPLPLSPQTYTQAPPPTSTPATTSAVPVPPTTVPAR